MLFYAPQNISVFCVGIKLGMTTSDSSQSKFDLHPHQPPTGMTKIHLHHWRGENGHG